MFNRLRQSSKEEGGFTLIELLVVILIIDNPAEIAIYTLSLHDALPIYASAKVQARTAQTAMETAATDQNGSYLGVEIVRLREIEPTLKDESQNVAKVEKATATEFEVASENKVTKNVFKILRNSEGVVTTSCTTEKVGACPPLGKW